VHGVFFAALLALASPIAELRPQFGGTALAAHGRCEVEPNGGLSRARIWWPGGGWPLTRGPDGVRLQMRVGQTLECG